MPSDARAPKRGGYYGKKSLVVMYFAMGAVFGVLAVVSVLKPGTGNAFSALPGIMLIWLGIWMSSSPIVRVEQDHVSWKGAPLAPRRDVLFGEIQSVEQASPKKAYVTVDLGGKPKKLRLPLGLLSPEDAAALVRLLREKAPKA